MGHDTATDVACVPHNMQSASECNMQASSGIDTYLFNALEVHEWHLCNAYSTLPSMLHPWSLCNTFMVHVIRSTISA